MFFSFRGLDYSFHTLAKIAATFLIALKFGTNKEYIKVNLGTEFGINLISVQRVRSNDVGRK